jgi:hypothetical protein
VSSPRARSQARGRRGHRRLRGLGQAREALGGRVREEAVGVALEVGAQARRVAARARLLPEGAIGGLGLGALARLLRLDLGRASRRLRLEARDLFAPQVAGLGEAVLLLPVGDGRARAGPEDAIDAARVEADER